ncbi:hypothetical protein ACN6TW_11525 [Acinetobacter radioresistens]|uniref:Uncharacterized protein n=1 Tax=Acinetobacter radioresistens SK82 TaxID=596318 RepID=A0ABM9YM71_ACIRA|nr:MULTISPECIES: hypothetical protein [Acinetobacter]HAD80479.1 hypothetical protein [Flavobacteriaceae bacterium]EET82099.1 hypothetical protein ACIRA0001_0893 [Acinetobacter radioresistens SK82]EEY87456.1 hypothetical protein HMPREF0018_00203 [Acinetobacter radioresistens SH164]EXB76520.1 hypothetical protein J538_3350 [Acinetobacter sp. 272263]EXE54398.1 hypothetical protein J579_3181 [Acinetobacter sp. 1239920]
MYKSNHLTIEGLFHDPRAHMVNRLIFNGVTDAEVLIASTDKLLGFIGKKGLFDEATPDERALSNWRKDMVERLMHQGLTDADLIINTTTELYNFLIFKRIED